MYYYFFLFIREKIILVRDVRRENYPGAKFRFDAPSPNFFLWRPENDIDKINLAPPKFLRPERPPFRPSLLSLGADFS